MPRPAAQSKSDRKASDKNVIFPDWVNNILDLPLAKTVREALGARRRAVRPSALQNHKFSQMFKAAENAVELIEFCKVTGKAALRQAIVALRKYEMADDCPTTVPSARRKHA